MVVTGRSGDVMKMSLSPNVFTPFVLVLTVGERLARASLTFLKMLNGRLLLDPVVSETKFCPLGVSDARLKLASFRRALVVSDELV